MTSKYGVVFWRRTNVFLEIVQKQVYGGLKK